VWKYKKNPHGSPAIWVAEDKGRIVGCYILNPARIRIGRVSLLGAQSVDAAVDDAYRGVGIFKKLAVKAIAQATKEGVAIIFAFPTEIAYKGQVRIGYRPMFILPKMFKIFRPSSLLEEQGPRSAFLKKALGMIKMSQRIDRTENNTKSDDGLKVVETKEFDSRFETFWHKVCKENESILVERDRAYLGWRYRDHPENQYTTYMCEKNGEVVGYIVISVQKDMSMERGRKGRLSIGNIIDLLTLPNMTNSAFPLISASVANFKHENVDIARSWMFRRYPYHAILRKFGFHERYELLRRVVFRPKYNAQFICHVNSKAAIQEAAKMMPKRSKPFWFIMQGDSDYM
jgi:GNAT superfamily N-acetyltransferase